MKPWEETWAAAEATVRIIGPTGDRFLCGIDSDETVDSDRAHTSEDNRARARLAAASPEMARLLLEIQEPAPGLDGRFIDEVVIPGQVVHLMRNVLRKAGVLP